jgi:hypothetical protein
MFAERLSISEAAFGFETVAPVPHGLVAEANPALEKQVLDVPQRQRKPNLHHDHKADHLGR